jgi:hypothetical protein
VDGSSQLWRSPTTTLWHIDAGERGPSTPSRISVKKSRRRSTATALLTDADVLNIIVFIDLL